MSTQQNQSKNDIWKNLDSRLKQLKDLATLQTVVLAPMVFDGFSEIVRSKISKATEKGHFENNPLAAQTELHQKIFELPNGQKLSQIIKATQEGHEAPSELTLAEKIQAKLAPLRVAASDSFKNDMGLLIAYETHDNEISKFEELRKKNQEDKLYFKLYDHTVDLSVKLEEFEALLEKAGGKALQERNLNHKVLNDEQISNSRQLMEMLLQKEPDVYIKPNGKPNQSKLARKIKKDLNLKASEKTLIRNIF